MQLPRLLRAAELFPASCKHPALQMQPSPSGVAACTCTKQCSNFLCGRLKHDHSTHRICRTAGALQPSCVEKGGTVRAGVLQSDHCSISMHKQHGHKQHGLHAESTIGGSSCGSCRCLTKLLSNAAQNPIYKQRDYHAYAVATTRCLCQLPAQLPFRH